VRFLLQFLVNAERRRSKGLCLAGSPASGARDGARRKPGGGRIDAQDVRVIQGTRVK
jgi:hypothetical protein